MSLARNPDTHLCGCGCGQPAKQYYGKDGAFKGYSTCAEGHEQRTPLSQTEAERLRQDYNRYAETGTLSVLAEEMGRSKTTLARSARHLGLTAPNGKGRKHRRQSVWKYIDERQAVIIWEKFKSQRLGMTRYCKKMGFDDLGFANKMKEFFADEWEHVMESKQPRQGLYRYGRQFEYRTRDFLERCGYFVLRSPASKSPVDLVAIKLKAVLFVQCKLAGALGVGEWNALFQLAKSVAAIPLMATGHKSGRGVDFMELVGEKDGSKRPQPWERWVPEGQEPELALGP